MCCLINRASSSHIHRRGCCEIYLFVMTIMKVVYVIVLAAAVGSNATLTPSKECAYLSRSFPGGILIPLYLPSVNSGCVEAINALTCTSRKCCTNKTSRYQILPKRVQLDLPVFLQPLQLVLQPAAGRRFRWTVLRKL